MLRTSGLIRPALKGFYDAAITPTGAVSSWTDLSGNGNHWTQPTGGNQPVCTANQKNGRNTLVLSGASPSYLLAPSALLTIPSAASTHYIIMKRNTDSVLQIPYNYGGANPTECGIFFGAGAGAVSGTNDAGNTLIANASGIATTNYNIYVLTFNGTGGAGSVQFQINNTAPITASGTVCSDITDGFIGCRRGPNFGLTGGVASLAIYNALHSAAQIAANLAYFNSEWGIY